MIKLQSLYLRDTNYEKTQGALTGEATFIGDLGKVELRLSPEQVQKIIDLCAENIVSAVKQATEGITVQTLLAGPKTIEHQSTE